MSGLMKLAWVIPVTYGIGNVYLGQSLHILQNGSRNSVPTPAGGKRIDTHDQVMKYPSTLPIA